MLDDAIRKLNSKIINFNQVEFSTLIQESLLSDYFENGGKKFSLFCRNEEGELISFETENLFENVNLKSLFDSFIQLEISEFQITQNEQELVGYSGFYQNCWIVGTGDDIPFLKQVLKPIWHSIFEQYNQQ